MIQHSGATIQKSNQGLRAPRDVSVYEEAERDDVYAAVWQITDGIYCKRAHVLHSDLAVRSGHVNVPVWTGGCTIALVPALGMERHE